MFGYLHQVPSYCGINVMRDSKRTICTYCHNEILEDLRMMGRKFHGKRREAHGQCKFMERCFGALIEGCRDRFYSNYKSLSQKQNDEQIIEKITYWYDEVQRIKKEQKECLILKPKNEMSCINPDLLGPIEDREQSDWEKRIQKLITGIPEDMIHLKNSLKNQDKL